mgnify:CR=1 FL=1
MRSTRIERGVGGELQALDGQRQRFAIERERGGGAAVGIARHLVEQDDQRQPALGAGRPARRTRRAPRAPAEVRAVSRIVRVARGARPPDRRRQTRTSSARRAARHPAARGQTRTRERRRRCAWRQGCQTDPASNDVVTLDDQPGVEGITCTRSSARDSSRSRSSVPIGGARARTRIPPGLREWQGWVLHGEEFRRCPFAASADTEAGHSRSTPHLFRCVWPERLTLAVDARGGTFSAALAGLRRKLGGAARRRRALAARRAAQRRAGGGGGASTTSRACASAPAPTRSPAASNGARARSRCRCRSPPPSSICSWTARASRSPSARTAACGWASAAAPSRPPPWKCRSTGWCRTRSRPIY